MNWTKNDWLVTRGKGTRLTWRNMDEHEFDVIARLIALAGTPAVTRFDRTQRYGEISFDMATPVSTRNRNPGRYCRGCQAYLPKNDDLAWGVLDDYCADCHAELGDDMVHVAVKLSCYGTIDCPCCDGHGMVEGMRLDVDRWALHECPSCNGWRTLKYADDIIAALEDARSNMLTRPATLTELEREVITRFAKE